MKLTARQRMLLDRLDQITLRTKVSGIRGYFLDRGDCTATVNSLIVKGLVQRSPNGKWLHATRSPLGALG